MIRLLSTLFVTVLLTSPAYAQHPQSTLDKIKTTKTISLGYRESSFPFYCGGCSTTARPRRFDH